MNIDWEDISCRLREGVSSMQYDLVVLISIDTLRADAIGAYPEPAWQDQYRVRTSFKTPTLDALAREAAFFPNCVSAAPYTSASHGAIFSGRWPIQNGLHEYIRGRLTAKTIFQYAKAAGYRTVFKTDFPLILGSRLGLTEAVDAYIVEDNDAALAVLESQHPTLAFLHFADVHIPYGYATTQDEIEAFTRQVEAMEAEHGVASRPLVDQFVETITPPATYDLLMRYKTQIEMLYRRGEYDRLFEYYIQGVNRFDQDRFAGVIARLRALMEDRRVLLVVFADHGEDYTPEVYGHFNSVTEGSLHVPLLILGDGIEARMDLRRIRTIDVAPTVLDLLGIAQSEPMDGHSLLRLMEGAASELDDTAFAQTYTANSSDLARMQADLLENGDDVVPAEHFLTRECIYRGDYKLDRRILAYEMNPEGDALALAPSPAETLRRFVPGSGWNDMADPEIALTLARELDVYNASRVSAATTSDPDDEIRRRMKTLGYQL